MTNKIYKGSKFADRVVITVIIFLLILSIGVIVYSVHRCENPFDCSLWTGKPIFEIWQCVGWKNETQITYTINHHINSFFVKNYSTDNCPRGFISISRWWLNCQTGYGDREGYCTPGRPNSLRNATDEEYNKAIQEWICANQTTTDSCPNKLNEIGECWIPQQTCIKEGKNCEGYFEIDNTLWECTDEIKSGINTLYCEKYPEKVKLVCQEYR